MEQKNRSNDREKQRKNYSSMTKIDRILIDTQRKLKTSCDPVSLDNLTAYERKIIHSFFDNKPDYQTKTYRNDEKFVLKVFPVGNLRKLAEEKARHVLETGETVYWENLGNYERFIVHDHLKMLDGIETVSTGEGSARRLEIKQKQFGRSWKKIIKRIRLF